MESAEQHELNSLWEANWLYLSTPARDKDFPLSGLTLFF